MNSQSVYDVKVGYVKIDCMKEFNEYQDFAQETAIYPIDMLVIYPTLGLVGEAGEVADKIKKVYRDNDRRFDAERRESIARELGDVLWYLANVATDLGYTLEEIATMNHDKIMSRKQRNVMHGEGDDR